MGKFEQLEILRRSVEEQVQTMLVREEVGAVERQLQQDIQIKVLNDREEIKRANDQYLQDKIEIEFLDKNFGKNKKILYQILMEIR